MKSKQYRAEVKTRAVELLIESQKDYPSLWASIQAIAPKFGCTPETLRSWHKKHLARQNPVIVTTQSTGKARPQTKVMVKFIDDEKHNHGALSICRILPIAPSIYYRIKDEQDNPEKQSRRKQSDTYLLEKIKQIWQASGCRYGIRKVWHKLKQNDLPKLARCSVERLMKQAGIQGVWRGKGKITTKQRSGQQNPNDLVKRNFTADSPNKKRRLQSSAPQVADFTYIKTKSGWVYTAFVIDVFKRVIVGWKVSNHMDTQLVLDALNQALDARGRPSGVIHHSDKGSQYLSIKYGERLKQSGLAASVGTTGDSISGIALLRPSARRRAMLVVDAENIYYQSLIMSGHAA